MSSQIKYPSQVTDAFAIIQTSGSASTNPLSTTITSLKSRVTALSIVAQGFTPTSNLTSLVTNLASVADSLDGILFHSDVLSGVQDTLDSYSMTTRLNVLSNAINIKASNLDPTDTETLDQKTTKIFGTILNSAPAAITNLDSYITALEAQSDTGPHLSTEAGIQNPNLIASVTAIDNIAVTDDASVAQEITRAKSLSSAMSFFASAKDPNLTEVMSKVLNPDVKAALGL